MSFEAEVWKEFHEMDVTKYYEKTGGGANYVSWSKVWELIMDTYPRSSYEFKDERLTHLGDSGLEENVEVWCSLTIVANDDDIVSTGTTPKTVSRSMWLPVMKSFGTFSAIPNPSAREISDTRMRCLVKCAAMHGLGLSAWTGDDYKPDKDLERTLAFTKKKSDYRMSLWKTAIAIKEGFIADDPAAAAEAWGECDETEKTDLWLAETKGGFFTMKEKEWLRAATHHAMQPNVGAVS